jgi:hypothetical protein
VLAASHLGGAKERGALEKGLLRGSFCRPTIGARHGSGPSNDDVPVFAGLEKRRLTRLTKASVETETNALHSHGGGPRKNGSIGAAASGILLAIVLFFPAVFADFLSVRLLVCAVGVIVLASERDRLKSAKIRGIAVVLIAIAVGVPVFLILDALSVQLADPMIAINGQRLFVLVPLFLNVGFAISNSLFRRAYAQSFVVVALGAAALAVMESALGTSIFGQDELFARVQRGGQPRAVLASEHALVLGVMFAASIPMLKATGFKMLPVMSLLLVAGCWATGSRGPLLMAVLLFLVQLVPNLDNVMRAAHGLLKATVGALAILFVILIFFVWEPIAYGASGGDYSTEYRFAIYALLPGILTEVPFGYGLAGIPEGRWLFVSELRGIRDLSATVDSEVVYSALTFGVLGLCAILFALWVNIAALRHQYATGMTGLVVTICGLFLALHAWDTLGPFWLITIGASWGVYRQGNGRAKSPVLGSHLRL